MYEYEWNNIQIKTELEYVLDAIVNTRIQNKSIKRIFSEDNGCPIRTSNGFYYHLMQHPLYIEFEDNWCLVFYFVFYSEIYIEYRKMRPDDIEKGKDRYNKNEIDYFNKHDEIYGDDFDEDGNRIKGSNRVKRTIDINGEYGKVSHFQVHGFNGEYEKWVSDGSVSDIITVPAGGDYFDSLTFILDSGVEVSICPEDAYMDGYYDLEIVDRFKRISVKEQELN